MEEMLKNIIDSKLGKEIKVEKVGKPIIDEAKNAGFKSHVYQKCSVNYEGVEDFDVDVLRYSPHDVVIDLIYESIIKKLIEDGIK